MFISASPSVHTRFDALREMIGQTPLLAIDYRFRGRVGTICAKAEQMNLSGSIKDRMALHILENSYATGVIAPGETCKPGTFPLGDNSVVHSGHGPDTTIGRERQTNPFVLEYLAAGR